jgi:peptidyl-prolyl cis-trans isomerase C
MTLKKTHLWVLLAAFAAAPAFAQNIAVVNGTPIPKARADALIDQLVHQGQQDTPQLQMAVREELVNREILMQEALRRGLPNRPDIKAQIAVAQQTVVLRALIEDFVKNNQPSDAEVTARYNSLIQDAGGKEYHLHHILVDNEQQAKDLIAKIKAGASFEDLAKQYSKDPGSGKNGGDLDWSDPKACIRNSAGTSSVSTTCALLRRRRWSRFVRRSFSRSSRKSCKRLRKVCAKTRRFSKRGWSVAALIEAFDV